MKSTATLLPGAVHLTRITAGRQLDHFHNPHLVDAARIGRFIIGHQVNGARVEGGRLGGIGHVDDLIAISPAQSQGRLPDLIHPVTLHQVSNLDASQLSGLLVALENRHHTQPSTPCG